MTILNHPSEETLISHAGGTLPRALHLVVAMHVENCVACREEAALWEKVGGEFLADLGSAAISPDLLARTLERLAAPAPEKSAPPQIHREYWLGSGIRYAPMLRNKADGTRLYRLRVRAGTPLPAHGHDGRELTYVVSGEIVDGNTRYIAGDIAEAGASHEHAPRAGDAAECVCIVASEGPPRLPGLIGSLIRAVI